MKVYKRLTLSTSILAITLLLGCSHLTATKQAPDSHQQKISRNQSEQAIDDTVPALDDEKFQADGMRYPQDSDNTRGMIPDNSGEIPHATFRSSGAMDRIGQSKLDEALDFCEVAQSFWQKGELENALDALDKAYALIIDVDTREDEKLIQQKEDLRYLISKRILEIYASRNIVVNGNHDEIPLELNKHVEAELKSFTGYEKKFFSESYARSGKYRTYMVEALKKEGLPEELSWLPLIESGFKVKALSRARALGLWQFIPSTGSKFGLKRNRFIDERMDFIKSTDAAIAYLKELHNIFGDWATVLAAYNCGEGRVLQVIRTQKVNYLDNFWDLYQRLPSETARYVPRFFATLHIIKNPEKYGFNDFTQDPALNFDTVEINRQIHLKDVAQAIGVEQTTLETLNPELRYHMLPPEVYTLRVPKGQNENLLAALDNIPERQLPQRAVVYHRVRSGQTLSTIANKYRTSVRAIMQANNMRSTVIRAGKTLKIPVSGYGPAEQASSSRQKPTAPSSGFHRVRKGDSLWNIAKRYETTVENIKGLNHLTSNRLSIGQSLKIPGFKPEPLPDSDQLSTYSVKNGDSLYAIALKHKMELDRLLTINKLTSRSKIYPGQKLYIE